MKKIFNGLKYRYHFKMFAKRSNNPKRLCSIFAVPELILIAILLLSSTVILTSGWFISVKQAFAHGQAQTQAHANNGTLLTYQNPDFGIKLKYPSNWTKIEDGLLLHTIVAFQLQHENIYDFTNTTLAEIDLRVYNSPPNETSAKLGINQIYTGGQTIIGYYKNSTTTLGGLPAIKIVNYYFGDITQKEMQIWTFVPNKHILFEILYIAPPSKFSLYLPAAQKLINSLEIAK
ncbi:hypothetical protein [Nitrososphaera sp. AFS]|uniref:hypothetical protein n=1 Tax=Nitrososphaera sp. AFS TaxID=2301191 RepID=UPI00139220BD|nr:hypothetical protein [Nitrososphaera sp. AFS]NAL78634.1 hypothetical protein [Nitrososphaera sp. AFS]